MSALDLGRYSRRMKLKLSVLIVLIPVLALGACAAPVAELGTATEDATTFTPAPSESDEAELGALDDLFSECVDPEGDGALGGDLTGAQVVNSQGLLFVSFMLAGNAQAANFDTATLQVFSYGLDGNGGYIIGTKFAGGSEVGTFVFDNTSASQENLDNGTVFADGTVAMRAPLAMVSDLADGFTWRATLSVDGQDVDECAETTVPAT